MRHRLLCVAMTVTLAMAAALMGETRAESLTGRWSPGEGKGAFVLKQSGEVLTGFIESTTPGGPTYKIVDGTVKGNEVVFFVLHSAADDPEVKDNGGNPFHNFARGTVNGNEMTIAGSRENSTVRQYKMVLKRMRKK